MTKNTSILGRCAFALLLPLHFAAFSQDIPIGEVLSITGRDGVVAKELRNGREACTRAVNASGGIHGHMLGLITRDDRGDPKAAIRAAQALAESDNVVALLGPIGREVQDGVLHWASDSNMPILDPYGGAMASRVLDFGTTFFVTANFSKEGELIAAHLASLGVHDLAVLGTVDDQGSETMTALDEPLSMISARRVWSGSVKSDGSDAALQVEALLASHPQALVLATSGTATAAVLKALRDHPGQIQLAIPTYGLSTSITEHDLLALGAKARGFIMTQVVPSPRDTQVAIVAQYRTALRKGDSPTYVGLQGCIDVMLLAEVLGRHSEAVTRSGVLRALRSAGTVDVGGFRVNLSDRQQTGSKFTEIVLIDGEGRIQH